LRGTGIYAKEPAPCWCNAERTSREFDFSMAISFLKERSLCIADIDNPKNIHENKTS